MNPSQRATIARAILASLDSLDSANDTEIIFRVFGLRNPERGQYGEREEPYILADASDGVLTGIADHLGISVASNNLGVAFPECWADSAFRVFISHLSVKKNIAKTISTELATYGFDCFVAHEDIEPTAEWIIEIQSALRTCEVMIAIMSDGFRESDWCDQEIGAAVGRMLPIVSLFYDKGPHGFAGQIQGLPVKHKKTHEVVPKIVERILRHPSTSVAATRALITALRHSSSWVQSNKIAAMLPSLIWLDSSAAGVVREAMGSNGEVSGAFDAAEQVPILLSRFEYPLEVDKKPSAPIFDDIPF